MTGTWEIVVAALAEPVLAPRVLEMGIVVESHVARGAYSAMCAAVAADALEWLRGLRGTEVGPGGWEAVAEAARRSPPGSRGALFLPHMAGSTCPNVDPRSMGAFVGLRGHATFDDLTRSVIEGLDYQFREILASLEAGLEIRAERIVAVGGAVRNDFWMQNKADVSGKPVEVPAIEEATPLGAAILAGIGTGVYRDEDDALERVKRPGKVYEPDAKLAAGYDDGFEIYRRLYPSLKGIHWSLFSRGA